MPHLAIVIPTYQEAGNVTDLLTAISAVSEAHPDILFRVLIVDDSSPDGTADRAKELQGRLGTDTLSIEVDVRPTKDGLGAAYVHGFRKVLAEGWAEHVLQMDADLSHHPDYIHEMIRRARGGADLVVASRYIPGGGTPDWGLHRKLLSRGGNAYIRRLLGRTLTDYTGAFSLFTRDLLEQVEVETITASGYGFQIVLKHRASKLAHRIEEVPIVFMDRRHGESKIPKSTLLKNFVLVTRMRFGSKHG